MNRFRLILFFLAIYWSLFTHDVSAQEGIVKPEIIESISANQYDADWYRQQAAAWQKVVDANPEDQWAWRNLFHAINYYDSFSNGFGDNPDESRTADVIRKMEATLPDSYVLNLCKTRFCLSTDESAKLGDCIRRAVELMPDDAYIDDVERLACRMWIIDQKNPIVAELFTKSYKGRHCPARIMKYNWNMLQSMEENAIYFGNGDNCLVPMKMLQDALGIRKDVTIIPLSYLFEEEYKADLLKALNIPPITVQINYSEDWIKQYYADCVMHIIKETGRPAYFFTDVLVQTNIDKDSLYNEGLLLKYSDHQYDNFAVAMRNVKEVYHLEYLAEPDLEYDSWETSARMDMNNVTLLSNLVSKLRDKGDVVQAERLYAILDACVKRCNIDPEAKASIAAILKAEER